MYIYIYIYISHLQKAKTLNSKPTKYFWSKSVAHWITILLLSAYPKSATDSTQAFSI